MKTSIPPVLITFALVCFALVQNTQAVSPPPDGAYPGNNTAEGQNALFSLTSGVDNTAVGFQALFRNTTGSDNTATGAKALQSNTTGIRNSAFGKYALFFNSDGVENTAVGFEALYRNGLGAANTATGGEALFSNISGQSNTAEGYLALFSNTNGDGNTAIGDEALFSNTTGSGNTAIGFSALDSNTTGDSNIAIGVNASFNVSTGNDNIAIGTLAGTNVTAVDNVICIGSFVSGANRTNSCYIGNIWQRPGGSQAVYVNAAGKLGAQVSSRRFKDDIKPMEETSEVIYRLKPVSFRYKPEIEPTRLLGFGLIAEDVEKINPDLVARDKEGKPYTVRYDAVNAMLLNEFLKEHRTVQELRSTVQKQQNDFQSKLAQQQKQIEALTAGVQKVSAELELSKRAPETVSNNH
jgi:trimeric autotransporter adhesin